MSLRRSAIKDVNDWALNLLLLINNHFTVLPYVIQQAPNLDFDELKKGILLTAWDPNCVNHHLAESYLISEFIKDVHDPVESTREKFHNNKLLDDVIYKELTVVQQGVASGKDPKELVRRLGKNFLLYIYLLLQNVLKNN